MAKDNVVETKVTEGTAVEATVSANAVDPMEKDTKVVFLPLDDTHKRPLFVCVNGRSLRVPRGKNVEVPKEFAEAIRNAMEQEAEAIRYSDSVAYTAEG